MATLDEIFSDPKTLEAIFRGLIGAGTAAAGIQQATTPQTTTTVRGAPAAASPLEQEALGLGFGTLAAGLPGQGITRTATGLSFQPTGEEQQSALGLNRALASMNARVGGGPLSLQGPADALSKAALTRKPAFDRSRLIAAIQSKMTGPISATPGQGSVLNLERGQDGVFSLPAGGNGGVFNIPSSFVNLPSSETGAIPGVSGRSGGGGGASSFLPTATGILGAGAGALQVAKALGLIGGGGEATITTAKLLAEKIGIGLESAQALIQQMPLLKAVDLGLQLRGIDTSQIGEFGKTIFPEIDPSLFGPLAESALGLGGDLIAPGAAAAFPGGVPSVFSPEFGAFAGPGADLGLNFPLGGGTGALPGLGAGAATLSPAAEAASPLALESVFGAAEGGAAAGGGGLIGMGGLPGALSAIGIPLSFVLGSLPFIGQRAKKEKAKEIGLAQSYFQQIQSDPQGWVAGLERDWGPMGRQIGEAALQGKINGWGDILNAIGLPDLKGQLDTGRIESLDDPGDSLLPPLSQWATRFIAAPGEKWYGPILIESNRGDLNRAAVMELLKNPEAMIQEAMRRKGIADYLGQDTLKALNRAGVPASMDILLEDQRRASPGQVVVDEEGGVFIWDEEEGNWVPIRSEDEERNDE